MENENTTSLVLAAQGFSPMCPDPTTVAATSVCPVLTDSGMGSPQVPTRGCGASPMAPSGDVFLPSEVVASMATFRPMSAPPSSGR